ncbi:FCD domain-containing protein [Ideonella azotifigens]|uniref:HTH gntR-type domain-containing protein n=1 Tax=Ideonella azotifigens TaxID=513160 RepID=A0ABP3VS61_9BURK|nr:FCD domain-containing protein [Ideonella azotifigens]MCD2339514.1 FCD domain-containing protein [Ideonella azotifigens]
MAVPKPGARATTAKKSVAEKKSKPAAAKQAAAAAPKPSPKAAARPAPKRVAKPVPKALVKAAAKPAAKPRTTGLPTTQAEGRASTSLVKRAVDALRQRILAVTGPDDAFLGSEEQLIATLGVSRPTFRQAARLLEHEALLKIKRGIGGGFFAQPPSVQAVSRMAAIFLSSQGATLQQIANATAPVIEEAAGALAGTSDASVRRRLAEHVKQHAGFEASPDEGHRVQAVLAFDALVGQLSGNPALALMLNLLHGLVRDPEHGLFRVTPARARAHAEYQQQLAAAVQKRDVATARQLARQHSASLSSGLPKGTLAAA